MTKQNPLPADVTAAQFLALIFGQEDVDKIWTCGFPSMSASNWTGALGVGHLSGLPTDAANFYFCIGEMDPAADRRANDWVIRQHLIIADDVGTKADPALWQGLFAAGFPEPTFRIQTSPGNETWGWRLDNPVHRDTDPDGWADVALVRAWLNAMGLTDPGVADPARYIRLPLGWNDKPKYVDPLTGMGADVKLLDMDLSRGVTLDRMGRALHGGRADWRDVPLPPKAMGAGALARSGAITRCADLNNPEPLMVLWQEMGGGLRQVRAGVVEANCPNMADHTHDGREDSGFAFLGNGLMECSHGHCQHLSTPGFKQMMMEQFDAWTSGLRAVGLPVPRDATDAKHFLTLVDLERHGALSGAGMEAAQAEAEGVVRRQEDAADDREEKLAALAYRFVWVQPLNAFVDTKTRQYVSAANLCVDKDVVRVIPAGTTGKKAADKVLFNREDRRDAIGVVYRPGDANVVVSAKNEHGFDGPHVNMWVPGDAGRRPGAPTKWLALAEHLIPAADFREWLFDWFAWVLQNPAQRTPVIPFIVSGQGSGKDLILQAIVRIVGQHNATKVTPQDIASPFNEWARRRFLHLDEVKLDAGGAFYNKIKALTGTGGESRVTINEKNRPQYRIEFAGVFIAMANEVDALRGIEHDDRRFAPYLSPAGRINDVWAAGDFAELQSLAEIERVHEFLMSRDVSQFDAHVPPADTTGSRAEVIAAALPEGARAACAVVTSGGLKHRRLFTVDEVVEALQTHPNPNVRNHTTANVAVRGIRGAGCVQASNGQSVRIDGAIKRLWVGANVDLKERERLSGKNPAVGALNGASLRAILEEDVKADLARAAETLGV